MADIRVARLIKTGQPLEIGWAPKPSPSDYEVLVRVVACGLVPNTANIVRGLTPFLVPEPTASFGLDVSGTIEAIGAKVIGLQVGQRVYVDPLLNCGTCHNCRRGWGDYCPHASLRGYFAVTEDGKRLLDAYPYGGLSEYVVAPHVRVARLPDSIDFLTAARFGYLGTSFGALRKGGLRAGHTLLINGVTGTLGVAAVAIALGMGAAKVLGIGRNRDVLKRVKAMDPDRVFVMSSQDGDIANWAREMTEGEGADVGYDCLGVGGDVSGTSALLKALKAGGPVMLVAGGVLGDISQKYFEALMHDTYPRGSNWFSSEDLDRMVGMIAAGVIDTRYLEHKTFHLQDVNEAIAFVGARPGGFTNVAVTMD